MKKLIIPGLLAILLLSSLTLADVSLTDLQGYFKLDEGSGTIAINAHGLQNGTLVNTPTYTTVSKLGAFALNFTRASNEYVDLGDGIFDFTGDMTMGGWILLDDSATQQNIFARSGAQSTNTQYAMQVFSDALTFSITNGASTFSATTVISTSTDYQFVVARLTGNTISIFLDNVLGTNATLTGSQSTTTENTAIGTRFFAGSPSAPSDATQDEFWIFNRSLSDAEISEIFDDGDALPFPWVQPVGLNESLERTFVDRQEEGEIITTVGTMVATILSQTVNVTNQINNSYLTATLNVLGSTNNQVTCTLVVDSVDTFGSASVRDNVAGEPGSLYVATTNFSLDPGNHDFDLICARTGNGGNIQITNSIEILHAMINDQNQSVNYLFHNTSETVGTGANLLIDSFTFTTSNAATDTAIDRTVVVNWNGDYTFTNTGTTVTQIRIDNLLNCTLYPTFGSAGEQEPTGGSCLVKNVGASQNLNISVFANSTTASNSVEMKIHVKEFIAGLNETASLILDNATAASPFALRSVTLDSLFTLNITNAHHGGEKLFIQAGIPVLSNDGTTMGNIMANITGAANFTTRTYNITMEEDQFNILIFEDVLEPLPTGEYKIELFGSCDNANCTLQATELIAYITNPQAFDVGEFVITAVSNATLGTIIVFNATFANLTITTTDGSIEVISTSPTISFTVDANQSFPTTILNHDTLTNITVNLTPWTTIFVEDSVGNTLFNFTANFTQIGNNTNRGTFQSNTSGEARMPLQNGTFLITVFDVNSGGTLFSMADVTLTASDFILNHTFTVFETNSFNIVFLNEETRALLDNTNITVAFISSIEALEFNTSNGTLFVSLLTPAEIEIRYNADNFEQRSFFIRLENQTFNNLTLFLLNSTTSTQIIVRGVDTNGLPVEGVIYQVLRQYIVSNQSIFEVVEMDESDFDGEAVFNLELNTPKYSWRVVRNVTNNEVLFSSIGAEITNTVLSFILQTLEDPLRSFRVITGIGDAKILVTIPTYNNVTGIWTATYEIPDATIVETVCLTIDQITNFGFTQVNQSCTTANTATLTSGYRDNVLGSKATLELTTTTKFSDYLLSVNTFDPQQNFALFGGTGIFLGIWFISTISLAFLSNAALMILASLISVFAVVQLNIIALSLLSVISLVITGLVILFSLRK